MRNHYNIVCDAKTREVVLSMLYGDIDKIENLIRANDNRPLPIGLTDSYEFAYALYDAFRFDKEKSRIYTRRVDEILNLHKSICSPQERNYANCAYVSPYVLPVYDDDEYKALIDDGIADIDITLTEKSLEFDESAVIELLHKGACPYYLDRSDLCIIDGNTEYEYGDISRLINCLSEEVFYYWHEGDYDKVKEPKTESDEMLSSFIEDVFNVAANQRMLYIIGSNITEEARDRGVRLMSQYLGQVFPIMDYEP